MKGLGNERDWGAYCEIFKESIMIMFFNKKKEPFVLS